MSNHPISEAEIVSNRVQRILKGVKFRDWAFRVGYSGRMVYIQVVFEAPDSLTGMPSLQQGRKWVIDLSATKSDILRTALLAVLTAVEHEAREDFRYLDRPVFGPHQDVVRSDHAA